MRRRAKNGTRIKRRRGSRETREMREGRKQREEMGRVKRIGPEVDGEERGRTGAAVKQMVDCVRGQAAFRALVVY